MKLNKFLLSAIAAASLTACSDSPEIVDSNKGHWNADGTGYVSLSISMPDNVGSKGTRAPGDADGSHNDKFNHGDLNEYAVYDATLVIFTADKDDDAEGDYKLAAAYKLPLTFKTNSSTHGQISSISTATAKIDAINAKKAKALVILNKPTSITLDEIAHTIKLNNGGTDEDLKNKTFKEFQKKTTEVVTDLNTTTGTGSGFTMTNAPLTTYHSAIGAITPTSNGKTTTLADITIGNIKRTAAEAKAEPAATIYVERSVAKVTLANTTAGTLTSDHNVHYQIEGFALDNTNGKSYIVRNADKTNTEWYNLKSKSNKVTPFADQYRFVGSTEVANGLYRTYWAEDPNYSSDANAGIITNPTAFKGIDKALYCMENTFDVANQKAVNTTRALLKVCFWKNDANKPGTVPTLYMYNNDVKTLNNKTDFLTTAKTEVNNIPAVLAYHTGVESITLTTTENYVEVASVKYNDGTTETTGEIFNIIKNHFGKIAVYKDGIAYYPVLIKHFGDQLTPWNDKDNPEWDTKQPTAGDINDIYPNNTDRDANYLGRYGVVRNNWYELKINNVKRPGKPGINTPDNTPDDELDSYISVSINILSWAKRSQDVDLQ